MSSLPGSESTSLFRVGLLILISVFLPNYYIFALIVLYLLLRDRRAIPAYIVLMALVILSNSIHLDMIPFAIVDCKQGNTYIADKIIYKVKIKTDEELTAGDILFFEEGGSYSDNLSDQRQNIRFICDSFDKKGSFFLRRILSARILGFTETAEAGLYGFLFHRYVYGNLTDISFGISSYYALKEVEKRSGKLCLFLIFLLSVCFSFEVKYLFLVIEMFCSVRGYDRNTRVFLQIVIFSFLNASLFRNYSILIPFFLAVFSTFELGLGFRNILFLLQSILFGEIDLIQSVFFHLILRIRIIFYLFSIILLFLPSMETMYIRSLSVLEKVLSFHLSIRGSPSLWTVLMLFLLHQIPLLRKQTVFSLVLILSILNPLNHPFSKIAFIDVGQGDATMIRNVIGHRCILIDTGSIYNYAKLKKYLFSQGIYAIDHLIISHDDEDHNGNIENLKRDFQIKEILTEGKDILYEGLLLKYHDLGSFDNDNDNSLVYSLDMNGIVFLFTGDISVNAENVFVQRYGPIKIDVLKVAHHGSDTSTGPYFIGSILPEYAVISTSGKYGHPKRSVLETLKNYRVYYYNTRYSGTVSFCFLQSVRFIETARHEFVIMKGK